ncbi:MAG: hypothetical protein ACI835_004157 [Planctomycetota bacterium]|jgi:hypothetical protein
MRDELMRNPDCGIVSSGMLAQLFSSYGEPSVEE